MRVEVAAAGDLDALIALAADRMPVVPVGEAGFPLTVPDMVSELSVRAAHESGPAIGFGWVGHLVFQPAGFAALGVVVSRGAEGHGVGSALYRALLPLVPVGTNRLATKIYGSEDRAMAVADHWGFAVKQRSVVSLLDLTELSPQEQPTGVTFEESPELRFTDTDDVDAAYRRSQTNPEAVRDGAGTLEQARTAIASEGRPIAVLARVDGAPAALVFGGITGTEFFIHFAGVDPAFRGRGLGRLTKQRAHVIARAAGATVAIVQNEQNNHGIRRVNADLGYQVAYVETRLHRDV